MHYIIVRTTRRHFLSNDHSFYASITSDECHAWFYLHDLSRPARSARKAEKYKMKNLTTVALESTTSWLRTLPNELAGIDENYPFKETFIQDCDKYQIR